MQPTFVHLKVHTEYSICDSLITIKGLLQKTAEYQLPAVAVADHMNIFAAVKFYQKARAGGIKPIIAADLMIDGEDAPYTLTALCQNADGYHNLCELLAKAYIEGQEESGKPLIQEAWLIEYQQGLIILSGGLAGDVGQALVQKKVDLAKLHLKKWHNAFQDRYYVELTRTERAGEQAYIQAVLPLVTELKIPVVATGDVRFISEHDFQAHEARTCIQTGQVLDNQERPRLYSRKQYLHDSTTMQELFADIPAALTNTVEIAKRCNLELSLGTPCLPDFPVPEGMTVEDFLRAESKAGLDRLWPTLGSGIQRARYDERLKLELDVIIKMGFPGYFLIVADFIAWAKGADIPVGPGRGSGAGSLVAYCLGITMLDPLEHNLLFERFLNPERVSMPDFDVDFCMDRRDEVIDYVAKRYGQQAVSQIITYGTMAAKAVIRDTGRVLGLPYGFVDKIAKLIPFEIGITLDKALQQEEALLARYRSEEEVATLIDLAKKLEGLTRNAGKHAGGVVIASTRLVDFTSLYCEAGGEHPVTQFDKDDAEAAGLVKFDFLGLRTLTIIHWALQAINARRKEVAESPIDIDVIPLNDKKTFKLLKSCATTAVFQLESRGMKDLIRRLQPDSFEEITALVALFRPGPLQSGMVDDFINRKHGLAKVVYDHPDLQPILESTYGVILYQEQVMRIAQVLAHYSLGAADILRRAMGKKKLEEMAKQRAFFIEGSREHDINEKLSGHIFDLMEKFAGYGFNKSHSAAYALIAYQTAYLKAHYPAEFMAAVLSSDMDNTDKVVGFIEECRYLTITVLPPNVNTGCYHFVANKAGEIIYGLGAIKGAGQAAIENLVSERECNGPYKSLAGFCERVDLHKLTKRALEPLIRSGAMDDFKVHRASLFASIAKAMQAAARKHQDSLSGQVDLFSTVDDQVISAFEYTQVAAWPKLESLKGEKETLGYYISGHPFEIYQNEIKRMGLRYINQLKTSDLQQAVSVAGLLIAKRIIITKRGNKMAVLVVEDHTGRMEVTLFPKIYAEHEELLELNQVVIVAGKLEKDEFSGGAKVLADAVRPLANYRRDMAKRIVLHIDGKQEVDQLLVQLPLLLAPYKNGRCPVQLLYRGQKAQATIQLGSEWSINANPELIDQLKMCCGGMQVEVEY